MYKTTGFFRGFSSGKEGSIFLITRKTNGTITFTSNHDVDIEISVLDCATRLGTYIEVDTIDLKARTSMEYPLEADDLARPYIKFVSDSGEVRYRTLSLVPVSLESNRPSSFEGPPSPSKATTQAVTSIADTTATGNGDVTDLGVPNPTQHGVCWNTGGAPTTADSKTEDGSVTALGTFTSSITGLTADTTYFVRAYITNSTGTVYGNQISFTTESTP